MQIEKVDEVTEEIFIAVQRLVPYLGIHKPIPSRDELVALVASGSSTLFIARTVESPGEVIGMLSISVYRVPTGIRSIVEDVVVDGSFRRQGVAKALLERAILHARQAGASNVSLTSSPQREAANHLYQSMGFRKRETNAYLYELK